MMQVQTFKFGEERTPGTPAAHGRHSHGDNCNELESYSHLLIPFYPLDLHILSDIIHGSSKEPRGRSGK